MRARAVVPGRTYLLTRRCSDRRFFLRPSPTIVTIFEYALARAAEHTGMTIHAWVAMSNHIHVVATDTLGERPRFMELLDAEIAKAVSAVIGRWGGFWESTQTYSAVELLDDDAIVEKIAYTLANPTSAGLVRHARRWPGATSATRRCGDIVVAPRPDAAYYKASSRPDAFSFRVEPPPGLDPIEYHQRVRARVQQLERDAELAIRKRGGKFLGEKRVCKQDPYDCPSSWEKRRGRSPTFASLDRWARAEAAQRKRDWLDAYTDALNAWRDGVRNALFPRGTWRMRRLHACNCAAVVVT